MTSSFAIETLGCKVNQYESSFFIEQLTQAGLRQAPFNQRADLYIVHSCAVTAKAAYQTRQLLRRARRLNPAAIVLAIGCDAQLEADRLANEQLATHILGSTEKLALGHWLDLPGSFDKPCKVVGDPRLAPAFVHLPTAKMLSGRARAYLKVQDGCDAFCSYCVVPYTRGKSRSASPEEVRAEVDRLLAAGFQEIVLTGIHLGQWGKDLSPAGDLPALLQWLEKGRLPRRLRLSSIEPMEWSARLIDFVSSRPWICPHFHVPLQSGSKEVLRQMNRPDAPEHYAELLWELRGRFPTASIGADVMVGFPGESEHHFVQTYRLVESLPLTYLHVFPFSPRPGVAAAKLPNRITGDALKQRTNALRQLGAQKKLAFRHDFLGKDLQVLVESEIEAGFWRGTSDNYIQAVFRTDVPLVSGSVVMVRAHRVDGDGTVHGQLTPKL